MTKPLSAEQKKKNAEARAAKVTGKKPVAPKIAKPSATNQVPPEQGIAAGAAPPPPTEAAFPPPVADAAPPAPPPPSNQVTVTINGELKGTATGPKGSTLRQLIEASTVAGKAKAETVTFRDDKSQVSLDRAVNSDMTLTAAARAKGG